MLRGIRFLRLITNCSFRDNYLLRRKQKAVELGSGDARVINPIRLKHKVESNGFIKSSPQ